MLSKSAAKAFFLGGTGLFGLIFVGLTWDTFRRIPKQTNAGEITPAVERGKDLWDTNNCMGCHTLYGEGAYYAPELTKVFERRGPVFMRAVLKDPEAMFPGQRKMVNYGFSDAEIDDLIEFFKWVGKVDLNGFPPKPTLGAPAQRDMGANAIKLPEIFTQLCTACHALGGSGGTVGPALDGVGTRRDAAYLTGWLKDPQVIKPGTTMPKFPLTDEQLSELVQFLAAQKEQGK
ncbi:MAG: c-type cytochrome [Kofleriaceae bacterium]|nr:c-type cytochrome [Kofleriaceae bacterium]